MVSVYPRPTWRDLWSRIWIATERIRLVALFFAAPLISSFGATLIWFIAFFNGCHLWQMGLVLVASVLLGILAGKATANDFILTERS